MGTTKKIEKGPVAFEDVCLTTIYTITSNTPNSLSFSVSFGLGDLECRGNPVEIGIITLSIEDSKLRQSVSENSLVRFIPWLFKLSWEGLGCSILRWDS